MNALLVDDREENLRLLELTLRGVAQSLKRAHNGDEALGRLSRESFDLIVSDVMMPKMDGFQFCRAVRENRRNDRIVFVFVTATYTDPKDEALALRLGADAFFTKPIDPDAFTSRIQDLLARRTNKARVSDNGVIEDATYWKEYASRIVSKLEDKISELELAQHKQKLLNETLEARVAERTAALAAKASELTASNRELSTFAHSIAHDFRSPLRSIGMLVDMVKSEAEISTNEHAQTTLRRIERTALKMNDLVDALLSYTSVTTTPLSPDRVDVQRAVETVTELLAADIRRTKARVEVRGKLGVVWAHRTILEQVLLNLIGNGIKFVASGVQPVIIIGRAPPERDTPASYARYWIEDNGIGIPSEYHQRIFGMFERLHSTDAYSGSGLGLAIVRRGMERMTGRVGVESEPTQGACFWFELPQAAEDPSPALPPVSPQM